jgi:hypothetical protein
MSIDPLSPSVPAPTTCTVASRWTTIVRRCIRRQVRVPIRRRRQKLSPSTAAPQPAMIPSPVYSGG